MGEYVTLLGAEQVASAARKMSSAAAEMNTAASSISESVDRLARLLTEDREARVTDMQEHAMPR